MERLLLHTCCAPCSVYCVESLRDEGIEPVSFWFNPNIHPYQEYKARRDTLIGYAGDIGLELLVREDYGLREFVRHVAGDIDRRCAYCYACRLEETARFAAEHGFTGFSTTLLVSPYQDHDGIRRAAERTASPSCTGISGPASGRDRLRPGNGDCICKNTAAACSQRRTGTPNKSNGTKRNFMYKGDMQSCQ